MNRKITKKEINDTTIAEIRKNVSDNESAAIKIGFARCVGLL
ncbi:MAG: hypothetical protein WA941_07440 [Nitrososphaeraceae archaeon]|jgi:hypothetical protein